MVALMIMGLSHPQAAAKEPLGLAKKSAVPGEKTPTPSSPRSTILTAKDWHKVLQTPLRPGEIDQLVLSELQTVQVRLAAVTTDEQFIRRATLDLTGQLPLPADVNEFVANRDPRKRARLIDRLLESD
jgi:hypothetical protein